jgi:monoterpene epsilon-lactone hydrolase
VGNQAVESVSQLLRENNPMRGETIQEMRANMDASTGLMPLPEDVVYTPVQIGGLDAEWTEAPEVRVDRVILYFHGGGYTIGSIATHRQVVADISRAAGVRVLSLAYRLGPEDPHPAAVEDAIAAYRFLLSLDIEPERIAFAGDSAGGGLTIAALIAVRDAGLAAPAAGVCISPWLDLTQSGDSYESRAAEDPLVSKSMLDLMSAAYLDGQDPRQPTASPIFAKLEGLPPILIQVGTAEVLLDDSMRFTELAKAAGVDVELQVWDDMFHVWHCFAALIPEGGEAITKIAMYLEPKFS